MDLSTRQLASFIQRVALKQPQDMRGCSPCGSSFADYGEGLGAVPWKWVLGAGVAGAAASWLVSTGRVKLPGIVRKAARKLKRLARKSRKARRGRKARRNRRARRR